MVKVEGEREREREREREGGGQKGVGGRVSNEKVALK